MSLKKRNRCRSCSSEKLETIYDFGMQPLAGLYPKVKNIIREPERYPLDLSQCKSCGLLQVTYLPPIDSIFHEEYCYSSSTIPSLVQHFIEYAEFLKQWLHEDSSILEFGCNDGVLLVNLKKQGYKCIGVDASKNVADLARQKGLNILTGFLTPDFVEENRLHAQFDLVTCSNVMAHVDDLDSLISAVKMVLRPNGRFSIEVHDGDILLEEAQFDTIYHEHLTYFSGKTLSKFVKSNGFSVIHLSRTKMHGGAIRLVAQRVSPDRVRGLEKSEINSLESSTIDKSIRDCQNRVIQLAEKHGELDGFGAAGRAQMFINITNTGNYFRQIYDDSSLRQGRFIVGTDIPITAYSGQKGGCCVILAWNYASAIVDRLVDNYEEVVTLLPEFNLWKRRIP